MTEMWVVEMLCGRAMRMSPQALERMTAVGRGASAGSEAEGWLEGGGDARPVHSTAQNPFQDEGRVRSKACRG
jgi:hypothetical protein